MFETQKYFQGHVAVVGHLQLPVPQQGQHGGGKDRVSARLTTATRNRIRTDYARKAGDRSNASNDSAWVYLEVES